MFILQMIAFVIKKKFQLYDIIDFSFSVQNADRYHIAFIYLYKITKLLYHLSCQVNLPVIPHSYLEYLVMVDKNCRNVNLLYDKKR
jgi:hypothetical protein